jgi:diguanylate cyclase (GGDEF)-like protein
VVSLGEDFTEYRPAQDKQCEIHAEMVRQITERTAELAAVNERLQRLAVEDGLTHLANRRHFDEILEQEVRRAARSGHALSLVMGDVDCFKGYNDQYGHPAGDRCLQAISNAMQQVFRRAGELVARYGGEEFAIILPGVNQTEAEAAAQRLREAIVALQIPHERSPVAPHVTISIGCATVVGGDGNVDYLLNLADEAMYESKHWGRNRVSCRIAA